MSAILRRWKKRRDFKKTRNSCPIKCIHNPYKALPCFECCQQKLLTEMNHSDEFDGELILKYPAFIDLEELKNQGKTNTGKMEKPYVICHMASTVDGRISSENWGDEKMIQQFSNLYEQCHQSFESEAWLCDRVTMEKHFGGGKKSHLRKPEKPIVRQPFIGDNAAASFAIAVDAKES